MWKLLTLSIIQSLFLAISQVFLKFALAQMESFAWTRKFWMSCINNIWFIGCGICFAIASLLWMYILKHFNFSSAYPMVSLSYIFGTLAALFIFHEYVPLSRWAGILLIVAGCCLVAK